LTSRLVQVTTRGRWPRWVYSEGQEPDYRFSFANERTFLAWIRTSLALLAGGVAIDAIHLSLPQRLRDLLAALLVALGLICALASWIRWARAEQAMRRGEPLPASSLLAVLTGAVVAVAIAVLVAGL
jgi:putative membrane protein